MLARSEKEFISFFNTLEDIREDARLLYPLNEILFLVTTGVMCCAESWREIRLFGERNIDFLREYFPYEHGIPSTSVLSRVFSTLEQKSITDFMMRFTESLQLSEEVIALDGKRLRGSDIHMLHAFATNKGIVIGQKEVPNKTNECPEIPAFLEDLDIKGSVVTADALNCHVKIADKVVDKGADYFLALKGNQKTLMSDVKALFSDMDSVCDYEVIEHSRGRSERRKAYSLSVTEALKNKHPKWAARIRSICMIESERHCKGETVKSYRYYVSSTEPDSKNHFNYARNHWAIENNLHWILDVVFKEDHATLSARAAHNVAAIRKLVLNTIKRYKADTGDKTAIKSMRKCASWSIDVARTLIKYLVD